MKSLAFVLLAAWPMAANAQQDRRAALDVESYRIAVKIDPGQQSLAAQAEVKFTTQDDRAMTAAFELHNSLNLEKVTDGQGRTLQTSRTIEDFTVRVNFPEPLAKGQAVTLTFVYGGVLRGDEESPIYGLTFAAVKPDRAWLLYPGRWFPVSGYTADRYTMELSVQAPAGFKVMTDGLEMPGANGPTFKSVGQPGFPGSLALVRDEPQKITSGGNTTTVSFTGERAKNAQAWADETVKALAFLTSLYGVPQTANMTLVETGDGAPGAYSAPGMIFLSPSTAGRTPSPRVLANQLTRQWWGVLVSPANRNHIWIQNGLARYSEIMYLEHLNGPSVLELEIRDMYVDALTVTEAPVRQAARYEDYSPEFFAVTGSKGGAVWHMLRGFSGDDVLKKILKTAVDQFANKPIATDDIRKIAEQATNRNLQGFFIQWLESTGAPEFKTNYTVFRTQKGFRVMGRIEQDLDTFRMPVEIKIETEGNPEMKMVEVVGPSTEFSLESFGKPRKLIVDPNGRLLRMSPNMRVAVAIRRGEQFAELGNTNEALKEYQKALEVNRLSSLGHYRVAEVFFQQGNYQSAANEFREAINGDEEPKWTVVWSHISLGKIFDVTGQRERALNEYTKALRTKDNTQGALEEAARYQQKPYQREDRND
jgi:tetratricopeptide (TPR) repeat protein